jgi:type I restriction-modification system DNA methylase subunit
MKAAARARVSELVRSFRQNEDDYLRATYNETQVRTDFITPMLEAFGWDVHNVAGLPLSLREVIEEATVEVGKERVSKRPDYELRLARQRKIFVEAKKPSVRVDHSREAAFQTRRYGYSASLPIAILTNFNYIAIYDCAQIPVESDEAYVARCMLVRYDEFEERFDEIWSLLSRQAVYSGEFDKRFAIGSTRHGAAQFDDYFLGQVRNWRERLALDINAHTPGLSPKELTYAVQLFLSRIIFLRICEDREIEHYETLKNLPEENTFNSLMDELRRADEFYDSGLFRLLDDERLGIRISDEILHSIITELYYPQSPYTFAVVETEVLGEIYEIFLGEEITLTSTGIEIVAKPEVRESGGVVPTPRYIVDSIVERTMGPAIHGKTPQQLDGFTVVDICCGSGIFLLASFELLIDHHLSWYLANDRAGQAGRTIYEATAGQWRLTFEEKRRILLEHIRGVDIDQNAVEMARFSLLLKLIENETGEGLRDYVTRKNERALPSLDGHVRCGNSLVSTSEWTAVNGILPEQLLAKINPFTWDDEFRDEMRQGGFNVIVGNPPYIRIQHMTTYSPEEVAFYQHPASPYLTAHQDNFDKYFLFIERAFTLLRPDGRLGVITQHKFMTTRAGRVLRRLISDTHTLEDVIHFGVKQVFGPTVINYTCILIFDQQRRENVRVEKPGPLEAWRYGQLGNVTNIPSDTLNEENWQFANAETQALFDRIRAQVPTPLDEVAEIFVGLQTSADAIYIFEAENTPEDSVTLRWNGQDWPIEKNILRPFLHDAPLFAFTSPQPNSWMIFPYEIVDGNTYPVARLIQPEEMERRAPRCLAYLQARRAELEERNVTGGRAGQRQFYQFGRSQNLTKFNAPKIILPVLSIEARYTYDDTNIMVTGGGNGPFYMIRTKPGVAISDHFLLAVLNHPLSEAFVRTNTSTFQGGYYSHGKQYIERLPIPIPADAEIAAVEALVKQLIESLNKVTRARIPHERTTFERQAKDVRIEIENRVSSLFQLSTADIEIVRAVLVPD